MIQVEQVFQLDSFTIVRVKDSDTNRTATGIARKSYDDMWDKERGVNIATGRAQKALELKLLKRKINQLFMG